MTTRIIRLTGLAAQTAQALHRRIYIHGTPEEKTIGQPASYGCIRMKSADVAVLYNEVPLGALVQITQDPLPKVPKARPLPPPVSTSVVHNEKPASQQPQPEPEPTSASGTLSVEQMRMGGTLAAERQKARLALGKSL